MPISLLHPARSVESPGDGADPYAASIALERDAVAARLLYRATPGQAGLLILAGLIVEEHVPPARFAPLAVIIVVIFLFRTVCAARAAHFAPGDARIGRYAGGLNLFSVSLALAVGAALAFWLRDLPVGARFGLAVVIIANYAISIAAHHVYPPTLLAVGVAMLWPFGIAWMLQSLTRETVVIGAAFVALSSIAWYISIIARAATDAAIRSKLRESELGQRLEARSRELEAAIRAKSQFLAAAGHDLRQPVTSLNLLLAGYPPTGSNPGERRADSAAHLAERMRPSVDAMRMILDSLLEMARLEEGMVKPTRRAVEVHTLLLGIQIEYEQRARDKGIEIRADLAPLAIDSDPELLNRIVRNLVDNALKFTPAGEIVLSDRGDGAHCVISVRDTGIGIPAELQSQVFEDYFQASNPNRDRVRGLGLGLSIVRRMVNLLGGTIHLESSVGVGSTFSLRLPLGLAAGQSSEPAELRSTLTIQQALAGKSKLLVVDDDPLIGRAFEQTLRGVPIDSRIVSSALEALALVRNDAYAVDIAIIDYRLPGGINGISLLEDLHQENPSLAAVLITGDFNPTLVKQAAEVGAVLLNKPFGAERLADAVAQARQLAASRTIRRLGQTRAPTAPLDGLV